MCLATSAVKPIKFQWERNGQLISENARNVRIEDGTSHSVLVFDSVELTDFGNYSCIAQNTDGTDKYTTELIVKGKTILFNCCVIHFLLYEKMSNYFGKVNLANFI